MNSDTLWDAGRPPIGPAADQHVIEMIDISSDVPSVAKATASARHGSQDIPLLDVPVMPYLQFSLNLYMYPCLALFPQEAHWQVYLIA